MNIRLLTAGESHGKGLSAILEGFPAHLPISTQDINNELVRRQAGYGRGGRMLIEKDQVEILSGVRAGFTIGSPITLFVKNWDYDNWEKIMTPKAFKIHAKNFLKRPRPGHADLPGGLKYDHRDLRNVLERASARETTIRVAAGAVAKKLLKQFGMLVQSHVVQLGSAFVRKKVIQYSKLNQMADLSLVRMIEKQAEKEAVRMIDEAKAKGDTLGGVFEIFITGVPPGLGSHVQWDRKLDARLAYALVSMQAVKGVEFGSGFKNSVRWGSQVQDEIAYRRGKGFYRLTNHAGGIEGGISNGEPIVVRVAKKPISTLRLPLRSVDIETKKTIKAAYERSDVCALPAASVIGEAICAWVIADAFMEKMGGDFLEEIRQHYRFYVQHLKNY